ncbi:O-antigen ligase family protein [Thalassolituus oleivorans]|uniref:O-antigen ligase family protein n=1 Tax=Thalassolituus oleivorans TaxID=187493 RepID=UPI0023EFE35C|nr:O-antigen ligase family protein [Thalassolituus oleivorans]
MKVQAESVKPQARGVLIFGLVVQPRHLPLWFLVLALPALPFIRESYPVFWSSQSIRPLMAFTALIFISLSILWSWRNKVIYASPLIIGLLGMFLGINALSTALSAIPWQGSAHLMEMLLYASMGLLLYHQLQTAPEFRALFSISLMLMLSLMVLRLLYGWISVYDPVNHPWSSQIAFAENIRHIGYLAAMLLPVGYSFLVFKTPKDTSYWLTFVYLTLAWGLVFWMGGRATFLALVSATVIFFIFHPRTLPTVLTAAVSGLLLSQLFTVTDSSLNLFRLFDLGDGQKNLNQLSSHRLTIYHQALTLWWEQSFLIGLGSDIFRYLRPSILGDYFAQPHSFIIQALLSSGLIGGLALLALLIILGSNWIQNRGSNWPGFIIAGMAATATGLIDGVFYHSLSFFTISIVLALSLSPAKKIIPTIPLLSGAMMVTTSGVVFFSVLSWQIVLSLGPIPSDKQLEWVNRYPLYLNAHHWISQANEKQAHRLLQIAVRHSDTPCSYRGFLTEAQENSLAWCIDKTTEK